MSSSRTTGVARSAYRATGGRRSASTGRVGSPWPAATSVTGCRRRTSPGARSPISSPVATRTSPTCRGSITARHAGSASRGAGSAPTPGASPPAAPTPPKPARRAWPAGRRRRGGVSSPPSPGTDRSSARERPRQRVGEEPVVEERREVAPGDLVGQRDEVRRRLRRAAVVGDPALQQREERGVADLAAQGVEHDGTAVVALEAEQLRRIAGAPGRITAALARRQDPAGGRVQVDETGVVEPQPLPVRRERLVEPEVLPAGGRDGVAEPLVGQLVGLEHLGAVVDGTAEVGAGEHRPP